MIDDNVLETNNQSESESNVEETVSVNTNTEESTTEGATQSTGEQEKVEFSDPNMQKAWTEKTQALAEQRKAIEAERKEMETYKAAVQQKVNAYDKIDADPELVDAILTKFGVKQSKSSEINEDDYLDAQADPQKMKELIRQEARKVAREEQVGISQKMTEMELDQQIGNYASSAGNEDFWALDKANLIEPQLTMLRLRNPNMDYMEMVNKAHQQARNLVNSITDKVQKEEKTRVDGIVREKKQASIDKGGKISVPSSDTVKGKSITDIANAIIKKSKQ